MQATDLSSNNEFASTGISGLDEIMLGGLPRSHVYLVEGEPGTGKTTLAIQYLLEGSKRGERTLYVTLSETCQDLWNAAASHGWNLDGIECLEVLLSAESATGEAESLMYHPSDIELAETLTKIRETIASVKPDRVVIDSLTEIRLQAETPLRYRREVLSFCEYLRQFNCTGLLLDEICEDMTAKSVVHGIIRMERQTLKFGPARRRIEVAKLRGLKFWDGLHDFIIEREGIKVFPRTVAAEQCHHNFTGYISSGLPGLDALLGGGLPCGSTTLLVGPAGSGKSSVASQLVFQALKMGEKAAIYTFDEMPASYLARAAGISLNLQPFITENRLDLRQIDPGELSPGQFAQMIREVVESRKVKVLVIDSLNGYINAMHDEESLIVQLHELATYLNQQGVLTIFIVSQIGLVGSTESPVDASYLTDNVVLFRLFEAAGEVRHAVSVVKKRTGSHERTIRELEITSTGLRVGEPLRQFQGVLTGVPHFLGQNSELLNG